MRTLLLNPPSYDDFDGGAGSRYQATREVWSFWYPTWLCYPAGMIKQSRVLDAPPENHDLATTVAIARDYDFVVLHTSTPSFRMDVRTAEAFKEANPRCIVAFVGGHPTAAPHESLQASTAIDLVVRREFDFPIVEVAEGRDWSTIKGISYRRNGAIHHNEDRPLLTTEELDRLPFVTQIYGRDLDYKKYNSPYCQYPYVSLYTGRGCPARCTFCLWPQVTTGHSYRVRSVDNVIDEVREMRRLFPDMKEVFFDDDTFTADPPRAREIARKLGALGVTWSTNSRANVDYETLKVMKDGGLRLFVIGYESGNAEILKNIKKGVSLERARRFTKDCHELGILIHGTFILGLPGETRETIAETMRFALEMNPETLQVSLASPYPGTHFYDWVTKNNFLAVDALVDETGYQKCTVSYPEVSGEEIYESVERFYRSFYFRPHYIFKSLRKMASDAGERKRLWHEGMQFLETMRKRRGSRPGAAAASGRNGKPSNGSAAPTTAGMAVDAAGARAAANP
jgi:hopanoid biosynthesis associated radical SAM protein HpnJ